MLVIHAHHARANTQIVAAMCLVTLFGKRDANASGPARWADSESYSGACLPLAA